MIHKLRIALFVAVFALPLTVTSGLADEAEKKDKPKTVVFATVGDTVITRTDFRFAFVRAAKEKFYHGTPVPALVAELQREVGQMLVDKVFLIKEAKRRGIKPDAAFVDKKIAELDRRNRDNPQWIKDRESLAARFKTFYEERDMLKTLKKVVIEEMPGATVKEVRKFYEDNPELFTEPKKLRVWVIILKVDPGADQREWDERKHQATKLISRLQKGEDFSALAKQYSDDHTKGNGGDMGFIHKGVLAGKSQEEAERLNPGEFSAEPVELLEGYAIIKRGGLILPKFHKFEDVKDRAGRLLKRELKNSTWENLKVKLAKGVPVAVDETIYQPLGDHAGNNEVEEGHK